MHACKKKKKWVKPKMMKIKHSDTAFLQSCAKDGCAVYEFEVCTPLYESFS